MINKELAFVVFENPLEDLIDRQHLKVEDPEHGRRPELYGSPDRNRNRRLRVPSLRGDAWSIASVVTIFIC